MGKLDRKKFRRELEQKKNEQAAIDPYKDFQGTASELAFLKFSQFMSKHRMHIFIGLGIVVISFLLVMTFWEFKFYGQKKATTDIEQLEKEFQKTAGITIDQKIQKFEAYKSSHSTLNAQYRASKSLSDLYAEKGDYKKASEILEDVARSLDEPKEVKAYYYYLCGNYRELAKDEKKALENYSIASSIIGSNRETPSFAAWLHFHIGRLQIAGGKKEEGLKELKKVLDSDSTSTDPALKKVRTLATYLILKTNKGS